MMSAKRVDRSSRPHGSLRQIERTTSNNNTQTVLPHKNDSESPDLPNLIVSRLAHAPFLNFRHQNVAESTSGQIALLEIHIRKEI
jgi:hypothetical protein